MDANGLGSRVLVVPLELPSGKLFFSLGRSSYACFEAIFLNFGVLWFVFNKLAEAFSPGTNALFGDTKAHFPNPVLWHVSQRRILKGVF